MTIRWLADVERELIIAAVDECGGDRMEAARRLGIGKTTVYRKMKEYGIKADGSWHKRVRGVRSVNENQDIG